MRCNEIWRAQIRTWQFLRSLGAFGDQVNEMFAMCHDDSTNWRVIFTTQVPRPTWVGQGTRLAIRLAIRAICRQKVVWKREQAAEKSSRQSLEVRILTPLSPEEINKEKLLFRKSKKKSDEKGKKRTILGKFSAYHCVTVLLFRRNQMKREKKLWKFSANHCVALIVICHSFSFIFTLGVLLLRHLQFNSIGFVFVSFCVWGNLIY